MIMCYILADRNIVEFEKILTKIEMWVVELFWSVALDNEYGKKRPDLAVENLSQEDLDEIKKLLKESK